MSNNHAIELIHGLPRKELLETIHFHHRRGEASERALGFYLLEMEERGDFEPLRDAAAWAFVHLDLKRADKLITLARRLEELPEIDAAFAAGEVSWTKVREIARIAVPTTESKWLEFARTATSREVEAAASEARAGDGPNDPRFKARRRKRARKILLTGEQEAVWDTAIRKIRGELGKDATPDDAAAEMARRALLSSHDGDAAGKKVHGKDTHLVVLHLGKDGSAWADTGEGRAEVDPSTIVERIRSGARTIAVRDIEGPGECGAIPFGRRGDTAPENRDAPVSPELREAVLARDGRCLVCGSVEGLTPHHLDSHADGGKSVAERLASLCPEHQGEVHDGNIILRVEEDGSVTALDRDRRPIGKARTAAEALAEAGEERPLSTIVRRGPAVPPVLRAPTFPSLDALPAEPSAAEWRALSGKCEWSPGQKAFIFHPDWLEAPAAEAPDPVVMTSSAVVTGGVRPAGFDDFVGQRAAVEGLCLAGRAARDRGEPLGHVLLGGAAGLGKTSLCRILAREFGTGLTEVVAGNIGDPWQFLSILTGLRKGTFLFLDEVHRLDRACEESLYSAMEDRVMSVVLRDASRPGGGSGGAGTTRCLRIRLEPFTLVAATTRVGALSEPFRARFRHIERLEPYGEEELAAVAAGAARRMGIAVSPGAAREIACRSRGTAREAVRLLERARDAAQIAGSAEVLVAHVGQEAARMGIDEHGLDRTERKAIDLLLERRRPLGRESLAARLGVDLETWQDVHEPWLERSGLIERTEAGRVATRNARELYGQPEKPRAHTERSRLREAIPELGDIL